MESTFKKYSMVYNLLYKDKNYQQEVDYVDKLMNENGKKIKWLTFDDPNFDTWYAVWVLEKV
jgi:hypothetical protein